MVCGSVSSRDGEHKGHSAALVGSPEEEQDAWLLSAAEGCYSARLCLFSFSVINTFPPGCLLDVLLLDSLTGILVMLLV